MTGRAGNYLDGSMGDELHGVAGYRDGHAVTCDVEQSAANPWGLYGVGGNAWEACASDRNVVLFGGWRGASWRSYKQDYLKCSGRYEFTGSYRDYSLGFRLVLAPG